MPRRRGRRGGHRRVGRRGFGFRRRRFGGSYRGRGSHRGPLAHRVIIPSNTIDNQFLARDDCYGFSTLRFDESLA